MSLILVRHGETDGNKHRIVQVPETPLNERGIGQARRVAERLSTHKATRIFASDLRRASMTAEPIAEALDLELELDPLFQERNFGDFRGQAYADIGFDIMAPEVVPDSGESWPMFFERVDLAWSRIVELLRETEGAGDLIVVTHGLVLRGIAERHLELGGEAAPERWGNTSVTHVQRGESAAVSVLNCTRHLDASSRDDSLALSGI